MIKKVSKIFLKQQYNGMIFRQFSLINELETDFFVENYKFSFEQTGIQHAQLGHNIDLFGIPSLANTSFEQNQSEITDILLKNDKNGLFLFQIDPTQYLSSKRAVSKMLLSQKVYKKQEVDNFIFEQNPVRPINIDELKVEIGVLDILSENSQLSIEQFLKQEEKDLQQAHKMGEHILKSIHKHCIPDQCQTYYPQLLNSLCLQIMQSKDVYLVDIPSIYHRQLLGNTLTLDNIRELFKNILGQMIDLQLNQLDIQIASQIFLGEYFITPKDIHMYSIINQLSKGNPDQNITLMVEMVHFKSLQRFIQQNKNPLPFDQLYHIPKKNQEETDENMIEKHALLDVMFDSQVWSQPYIKNQFPYILQDINDLQESDVTNLQKIFFKFSKKYQIIKQESLKLIQ